MASKLAAPLIVLLLLVVFKWNVLGARDAYFSAWDWVGRQLAEDFKDAVTRSPGPSPSR